LELLYLGQKLSSKIIRVSNELLQDSGVDIEAYLAGVLPTHWPRRSKVSDPGYWRRHAANLKGWQHR
jgi:hypothetical protein